jgi:hypothetical protein
VILSLDVGSRKCDGARAGCAAKMDATSAAITGSGTASRIAGRAVIARWFRVKDVAQRLTTSVGEAWDLEQKEEHGERTKPARYPATVEPGIEMSLAASHYGVHL